MARTVVRVRFRRFGALRELRCSVACPASASASRAGHLRHPVRRLAPRADAARSDPNADVRSRTAQAPAHGGGSFGGRRPVYCVRTVRRPLFPGQWPRPDECRRDVPLVLSGAPTQIFSGGSIATRSRPTASATPTCRMHSSIATRWLRIAAATARARSGWCASRAGRSDLAAGRYRRDRQRPDDLSATTAASSEFTPVTNAPGCRRKLREQLTATRVAPGRSAETRPPGSRWRSDGEPECDQRAVDAESARLSRRDAPSPRPPAAATTSAPAI